MNTQELHAAAAARLEKIESKLEELFEACQNETSGMTTDTANRYFNTHYKAIYDNFDALSDTVARVYWYTDPQNSRKSKQINHRHTVARMHTAGLNKMSL